MSKYCIIRIDLTFTNVVHGHILLLLRSIFEGRTFQFLSNRNHLRRLCLFLTLLKFQLCLHLNELEQHVFVTAHFLFRNLLVFVPDREISFGNWSKFFFSQSEERGLLTCDANWSLMRVRRINYIFHAANLEFLFNFQRELIYNFAAVFKPHFKSFIILKQIYEYFFRLRFICWQVFLILFSNQHSSFSDDP